MALRKSDPLFFPSSSPRVTVLFERLTTRVGVGIADETEVVDAAPLEDADEVSDAMEVVDAAGLLIFEDSVDDDGLAEVEEAACTLSVELAAPPDLVSP